MFFYLAGFHLVLSCFTGFYWFFLAFGRVLQGLYRILPSFSVFNIMLALNVFSRSYWVSQVFFWTWLCFTGFYWVLLGFTGFYTVILGFTGLYWLVLSCSVFHNNVT